MYVQSADVRFAIPQPISGAWNEHGLIREQSAQTAIRAVGIAWMYIYIYTYIYVYIYMYIYIHIYTGGEQKKWPSSKL